MPYTDVLYSIMLFAVVPTHVNGVRRSKEEISQAAQMVGTLLIEQLPVNSAGRPMLIAKLRDASDRHKRLLTSPLLDANLVKLTASGLYLVGYQIEVEDGKSIEFAQGWWAKFISTESHS